jgi:TPR repeat protein
MDTSQRDKAINMKQLLILLILVIPIMACEPETAFERSLYLAKEGYPMGSSMLGYYYLTGVEAPQNKVRAYSWYSISVTQGSDASKQVIASLEYELTPEQVALAQELATQCFESDFKDCGYLSQDY